MHVCWFWVSYPLWIFGFYIIHCHLSNCWPTKTGNVVWRVVERLGREEERNWMAYCIYQIYNCKYQTSLSENEWKADLQLAYIGISGWLYSHTWKCFWVVSTLLEWIFHLDWCTVVYSSLLKLVVNLCRKLLQFDTKVMICVHFSMLFLKISFISFSWDVWFVYKNLRMVINTVSIVMLWMQVIWKRLLLYHSW